MIKYALLVAVAYFAIASTAVALPGSTLPQLTSPNDIVQVGNKGKGTAGSPSCCGGFDCDRLPRRPATSQVYAWACLTPSTLGKSIIASESGSP